MWTIVPKDWDGQLDALNSALEYPAERWEASCLDTLTVLREISDWITAGRNEGDHRSIADRQSFRGEIFLSQDSRSHGRGLDKIIATDLAALRSALEHDGLRAATAHRANKLIEQLSHTDALVAAWDDLVHSAAALAGDVEQFRRYRNEFIAVAEANGSQLGTFGQAKIAQGVLADQRTYVARARKIAFGGAIPETPNSPGLYGMPKSERLVLARALWSDQQIPGHNVVWLEYREATLPAGQVTLGQVTFYSGDHLATLVENAERSDLPDEIRPRESRTSDWAPETDFGVVYARVELGATRESSAVGEAIDLATAMLDVFGGNFDRPGWKLQTKVYHYAERFVLTSTYDRERRSGFWQADPTSEYLQDAETEYSADFRMTDEFRRVLDSYVNLRSAQRDSPIRSIVASIELLELVKSIASGADMEWWDFATSTLKTSWVTRKAVSSLTNRALRLNSRDHECWVGDENLEAFRQVVNSFTTRDSGNLVTIHADRIYESSVRLLPMMNEESLVRAEFNEACKILSSGKRVARLRRFESDFETLLARTRRCRNSAAHGWPIDKLVAQSAADFAADMARNAARATIAAMVSTRSTAAFEIEAQRARADALLERMKTSNYPWT